MPVFQDLRDSEFGDIKPREYLGKRGWLCDCKCGRTVVLSNLALTRNGVQSCGHELIVSNPNLIGQTFGKLNVTKHIVNDIWECRCECGNIVQVDGLDLRKKLIRHCGDMESHKHAVGTPKVDLTRQIFGDWIVLGYVGKSKWECECQCELRTRRNIFTFDLVNGKTTSCGHSSTAFIDMAGKTIGDLRVIAYDKESKRWKCECLSCGEVKYKTGTALRIQEGVQCENLNKFKDLVGKVFGEWEVLEYLGHSMWKCECSCGIIADIHRYSLISGVSKSCGHIRRAHILGKRLGFLYIEKYLGKRKYQCRCDCGNIKIVHGGKYSS